MFCERCGASLPSHGFVCLKCHTMMSKSQIELQKKVNNENRKTAKPVFNSSLYGADRNFVVNKNPNGNYLAVVCAIVLFLITFVIIFIVFL